jgi:hypothetical protein
MIIHSNRWQLTPIAGQQRSKVAKNGTLLHKYLLHTVSKKRDAEKGQGIMIHDARTVVSFREIFFNIAMHGIDI